MTESAGSQSLRGRGAPSTVHLTEKEDRAVKEAAQLWLAAEGASTQDAPTGTGTDLLVAALKRAGITFTRGDERFNQLYKKLQGEKEKLRAQTVDRHNTSTMSLRARPPPPPPPRP